MPEPVTSIFNPMLRIRAVIFSAFIFGSVAAVVIYCIIHSEKYTPGEFVASGIFSIMAICFYVNIAVNTLIKIAVAPENLEIFYLITKKRMLINYDDIKHVSSTEVNLSRGGGVNFGGYRLLTIELSTGRNFRFKDNQFSNYDDLKEAIRRRRFNLD